MNTRIVCLGEAMVELSMDRTNEKQAQVGFAGDTLNTAIYLKRNAPDFHVAYATKLGCDAFSTRMIGMMQDEALDIDLVAKDPDREPGLYAISTDEDGERSFTYWRSASAARQMLSEPSFDLDSMMRADVVYASGISVAILPDADRSRLLQWVKDYRTQGGQFAFDSNYRPRLWDSHSQAKSVTEAFWRQADIGLPSVDDEQALFGDKSTADVLARFSEWGIANGALKRGSQGPISLDGKDALSCQPAEKVVDSTAAGDSFNAGYLSACLKRKTGIESMRAGHELANKVIGFRGALLPKLETELS